MLKFKGCPRCKEGDIATDRDRYGRYEYCIQCGYIRDLIGTVKLEEPQSHGVKKRRGGLRL